MKRAIARGLEGLVLTATVTLLLTSCWLEPGKQGSVQVKMSVEYPRTMGYTITEVRFTLTSQTTGEVRTTSVPVEADQYDVQVVIKALRPGLWDVEAVVIDSGQEVASGTTQGVNVVAGETTAVILMVELKLGSLQITAYWGGVIFSSAQPMLTARAGHALVETGGYAYSIGGQYDNSVVERYDPASDSWQTDTDMAANREDFAAGVIADKIYVAGGFQWTSPSGGAETSAGEVYDPAGDAWTAIAAMHESRSGPYYGVIGDKLYVAGGETPGNGTSSTLEVYDPATNTWTYGKEMPGPRRHGKSAVVQGKLYCLGGSPDGVSLMRSVWVYDPATDTWSILADGPAIWDGAVVALDRMIFVLGGRDATGALVAETHIYDTLYQFWLDGPPIPVPVEGAAACALSTANEILMAGGKEGSEPTDTDAAYRGLGYY